MPLRGLWLVQAQQNSFHLLCKVIGGASGAIQGAAAAAVLLQPEGRKLSRLEPSLLAAALRASVPCHRFADR
jgi:hypothetical protein